MNHNKRFYFKMQRDEKRSTDERGETIYQLYELKKNFQTIFHYLDEKIYQIKENYQRIIRFKMEKIQRNSVLGRWKWEQRQENQLQERIEKQFKKLKSEQEKKFNRVEKEKQIELNQIKSQMSQVIIQQQQTEKRIQQMLSRFQEERIQEMKSQLLQEISSRIQQITNEQITSIKEKLALWSPILEKKQENNYALSQGMIQNRNQIHFDQLSNQLKQFIIEDNKVIKVFQGCRKIIQCPLKIQRKKEKFSIQFLKMRDQNIIAGLIDWDQELKESGSWYSKASAIQYEGKKGTVIEKRRNSESSLKEVTKVFKIKKSLMIEADFMNNTIKWWIDEILIGHEESSLLKEKRRFVPFCILYNIDDQIQWHSKENDIIE